MENTKNMLGGKLKEKLSLKIYSIDFLHGSRKIYGATEDMNRAVRKIKEGRVSHEVTGDFLFFS